MPGSRRRRGGRRALAVALAVAAVVLVVAPGFVTTAVSVESVSRTAAANVVADDRAAHQLNLTSDLREGASNCLVTVTNRLGTPVTVTVALDAASTGLGTLHAGGASGDTVQFSLSRGGSRTVNMDVASGTNGSTAAFVVDADGTGLAVTRVRRSVPVVRNASTAC